MIPIILHVINDLATGGTEHLLVKHIQQLRESQPSLVNMVVVLGNSDSASADYVARLPSPPVFLGFTGSYRDLLASGVCLMRLRNLFNKCNPCLVHSYLWNANVFTELARTGLGVPHVVAVVDRRGDRDDPRFLARTKVRMTGRLFQADDIRFVAVSDACRKHALQQWRIDPDHILTAYNGIPAADFESPLRVYTEARPLVLGTISNFTAEKGHRYLLMAIALLRDQGVSVGLRIAGSGRSNDQALLEDIVARFSLSDRVSFVGRVPSAANFYRGIDLFVNPSVDAEGLPTTILEAMASGLPVLATDVGGATEAVRDGIEGVIVPPRDSSALAEALARMVSDPQCLQTMGRAGLHRVREVFTIKSMTETIYRQIYLPLGTAKSSK